MSATFAVRTTEPGVLTVFGRAAAAEWVRLRTVRTTWLCLLAGALTIVGIGASAAADIATEPGPESTLPATLAGQFGLLPGQFALLVLAVLAVTQEYAAGSIGPTMQWTPRRGVLLAARVTVAVVVATVAGLVLTLAADVTAWLIAPELTLTFADVAESMGRIAGVLVAGSVLAVGAGLLLRSTAGALATVFLLQLVLPFLMNVFGVQWMADLGELLPGTAAIWVLIGEPAMTATQATVQLVAWSGATLVAGSWSLLRRDAG
jgi:hypothetical protein